MKLTKKQLRSIINEEAKRLREASKETVDPSDDVAMFVSEALCDLVRNNVDDILNSVVLSLESLGNDVAVPARIEDIGDFAKSAVSAVMKNRQLTGEVEYICRMALSRLMMPV